MSEVRALVTGATGQDGSYLVDRLLADGVEVHALVRDGAVDPHAFPLPDGVHRHLGDLAAGEALEALVEEVEPHELYNLAGLSSVALSWERPALAAQVSGVAVGHLLEGARRVQQRTDRPVRVVQASSGEIFAGSGLSPQNEDTRIRPLSPYGAAKAFAHHLIGVYRATGMHAVSCILYNHESPRRPETFVTRKITAGAARIARGMEQVLPMGNLDARRDWGWAPDYVDAMMRAARADTPGDFVIATGVAHSVREFVAAAFAAAGIEDWQDHVTLDPRFTRPTDAPELVGDAARARDLLRWTPTVGFEELVSRMVRADMEQLDGAAR